RFDALLTDAIMPEMSGLELLAELRRVRAELPAILMSGYGGPDLNAAASAAGAHAVLMKPLGTADLAQSLAEVLAGTAAPAATQPRFAARASAVPGAVGCAGQDRRPRSRSMRPSHRRSAFLVFREEARHSLRRIGGQALVLEETEGVRIA